MMETSRSGIRLTTTQRIDWLRLIRSDNVGPRTFRGLLNRYGSAAAALAALPQISSKMGRPITIFPRDDVLREMDEAAKLDITFIGLGEPDYPIALRNIDSAPPMLAVRGNVRALGRAMVAIVGSRNASAAGLAFTERLARGIAQAGHVVVSGLARGIDVRAHTATLRTGTVAVLAGGHNKIYPSEHAGLVAQILENGAVVSEMPLNWEPRGRDFPRRNRIVSGLALGVVVIEAARHSGSLITAKFAAEQGREIFAVPGSPLDPRAEGTNDLLREGATICTRPEDVISAIAPLIGAVPANLDLFCEQRDDFDVQTEPLWDEIDLFSETGREPQLATPQTMPRMEMDESGVADAPLAAPDQNTGNQDARHRIRITALLGPAPVSIDELCRAAGASMNHVRQVLIELELEGRLQRHGGNLVSIL